MEQFQALHSKSQLCTAPTRALLLSTYIKWVNVFPEIKPQLIGVFERYQRVLDSDLQQRACEYLALAKRPEEDDVLRMVCEEMPPYPPRRSALLDRLNRKHEENEDKRTWLHGGREMNLPSAAPKGALVRKTSEAPSMVTQAANGGDLSEMEKALIGLDLTSTPPAAASTFGQSLVPLAQGPHIERWFQKLIWNTEGVLYEDSQLQVGIKSEFHGHLGRIAVYMGNKIPTAMTSFTAVVSGYNTDALSVSFERIPANVIQGRSQSQQLLHVECRKPFAVPPTLTISFLAGAHQTIAIQLPIFLTKFCEPVSLGAAEFFERWKLIGGAPREAQDIFSIELAKDGNLDSLGYRDRLRGTGVGLLDAVDPNPQNIVAAGILHMSQDGKVGCLMRLEPNRESKVINPACTPILLKIQQQCRLTIRSTSEDVASEILRLQKVLLEAKNTK
jgi:AP-2 complex subunit alpha